MPLRPALPVLSVLLALAVPACGDAPQVVVVTRVGEPTPEPVDGIIRRAELLRADRERELIEPALEAMLGAVPDDDAPARPGKRRRLPRPVDEAPERAGEGEATAAAAADPLAAILTGLQGMSSQTGLEGQIAPAPAPASDPASFQALLAAAREAPVAELAPLADALARTPGALWPEVEAALLAERKARKADYKALLALIGGDVPNRYGHFELG